MRSGGSAFALAIAIASLAFGARATADVPAQRAILAAPSPSPEVKPVSLPSKNQIRRVMDIIEFKQARITELARTKPRRFSAPASAKPASYQNVQIVSHSSRPSNAALDYCAKRGVEVDQVSGEVTAGGTLTFTGICMGSSGKIPMSINFTASSIASLDAPQAMQSTTLQVLSWTENRVTARIPDISGALDQTVRVQLVTGRAVDGRHVTDPRLYSEPIQLRFIAAREKIEGIGPVDNVSCEHGDVLHSAADDYCDGPLGADKSGWILGANCVQGQCFSAFHLRKSAGAGTDSYRIALNRGFVLDSVQMVGGSGEVRFDSTMDPTHVSWSVRWQSIEMHRPDALKDGHPEYGTYYDGSYLLYVTIAGPRGCLPSW